MAALEALCDVIALSRGFVTRRFNQEAWPLINGLISNGPAKKETVLPGGLQLSIHIRSHACAFLSMAAPKPLRHSSHSSLGAKMCARWPMQGKTSSKRPQHCRRYAVHHGHAWPGVPTSRRRWWHPTCQLCCAPLPATLETRLPLWSGSRLPRCVWRAVSVLHLPVGTALLPPPPRNSSDTGPRSNVALAGVRGACQSGRRCSMGVARCCDPSGRAALGQRCIPSATTCWSPGGGLVSTTQQNFPRAQGRVSAWRAAAVFPCPFACHARSGVKAASQVAHTTCACRRVISCCSLSAGCYFWLLGFAQLA